MTDTPLQPAPASPASPEPVAPAVPAPAVPAPVAPPAGFVPQATLEAEQTRARTFQAELDRTKAELAKLQVAPAPATPAADQDALKGFDPDAFQAQLLGKVYGATAIASAVEKLKVEFPHADPALFAPERLAAFGSPEALRIAAEADHVRVATILAAHQAPAAPAPAAPSPLGPVAPPAPGVDPTVAQLAAMNTGQLVAYEAANPGVIDRVMAAAQATAAA